MSREAHDPATALGYFERRENLALRERHAAGGAALLTAHLARWLAPPDPTAGKATA